MALKLQIRRDPGLNWTINNPELLPGEMGYETDTRRLKIGTIVGAKWNDIGYLVVPTSSHTHNTTDINLWTENIQAEIIDFVESTDDIIVTHDTNVDKLHLNLATFIDAPKTFQNLSYKIVSLGSVQGVVTLDLSQGMIFTMTLSDHITINVSPTFTSDALNIMLVVTIANDKTLSFSSEFNWNEGTVPTFTNGTHLMSFLSVDSGFTWHNIGLVLNSH